MADGAVHRDDTGTPQRGVISPVLCNVYLHRLDRQWTERRSGVLVRLADDVVVCCHTKREAEAALSALRSILAELGLESKAAKTRIVHLTESTSTSSPATARQPASRPTQTIGRHAPQKLEWNTTN